MKKRVDDLNKPEILIIDSDEDTLLPMSALEGYKEVKLQREETIAERIKLNSRKRKKIKQRD